MVKGFVRGLIVFLLAAIFSVQGVYAEPTAISQQAAAEYTLEFPSSRYPETGAHIKDAIAVGHSAVCTIDRDGAEENRKESLKGYPTKKGYDRDEWPMAMCAEGGAGADIRYITPSDNRGAGSWVSHQLDKYTDGTKVRFIVK
ncbi:NucA/NucB deoxyribonuclease domain-containing protein [Paenibacillus sp. A3M_27_13]|uniref:NucA/NucB deoxyribonuclease domain-containing protein n=1 Tax=Paenibacillus sp. A3M_27_13 TaxID=2962029 RepID=UPI0020B7489B|nr:NucA/NucB deoxyribonuclease domain-containing protein [Paenibacillus sp. A3M_27_13]MCP3746609.1 NucA/NucB deoxyribonuclease domain-containing protein [Paenibacillus sp. A3M_27_13]